MKNTPIVPITSVIAVSLNVLKQSGRFYVPQEYVTPSSPPNSYKT
jgi:hypothetical protein